MELPNNGQMQVVLDIGFFKPIHQDLGTIEMMFRGGGLPDTIKPEDVKALVDTQVIMEKIVAYIKKSQKQNEQKRG